MKPKELHLLFSTSWMNTTQEHSPSYWAFCSKDEKAGFYKQVCVLTPCRESLAVYLKDVVVKRSVYAKGFDHNNTVIVCLLLPGKKMFKKVKKQIVTHFESSVNLVNFFERQAGFNLTKAHNVKLVGGPVGLKAYGRLFIGPKEWIQSPYMLSIYVMLLRLGKFRQFGNIRNYRQFCNRAHELVETMKKFVKRGTKSYEKDLFFWPRCASHDAFHLYHTARLIMPFIKNLDKLFKNRTRESIFTKCEVYSDGFSALCLGKTHDSDLNHKFFELCKQKKIKIKDRSLDKELALDESYFAGGRGIAAYNDYRGPNFY